MKTKESTAFVCCVVVLSCTLSLLLNSCTSEDALSSSVTINGDFSEAYTNGRFVIWTPKQSDSSQGQGTPMMMAASSSNSSAPSIEENIDIVSEAPIDTNGEFSLTTEVAQPKQVYFYVLDATTAEGMKLAPLKGQQFILESGELTITMDKYRRFTVDGGHFNDEVINTWKTSDEYLAALQTQRRLRATPEGETEEQKRARIDELTSIGNDLIELEVAGLAAIATSHEELQVRKLALEVSWLIGDWYWEAWVALAEEMPNDEWVQAKSLEAKDRIATELAQSQIAIGTEIIDFTAEYLDGESVSLNDLQQDKSLVLLEFWASWCGPCRVEIPHLKKAYERFKDKGFEIVSFTIDDFKEDWELASEEEELPWPNLGMGQEADAATKYSVTGVPASYLFDATTGKIVALNLRGHKLDEMLEDKLL